MNISDDQLVAHAISCLVNGDRCRPKFVSEHRHRRRAAIGRPSDVTTQWLKVPGAPPFCKQRVASASVYNCGPDDITDVTSLSALSKRHVKGGAGCLHKLHR